MTIRVGPNTGLLTSASPGEGHYLELTRLHRWIDFWLNPRVTSRVISAPPGSPVDGAAYIIGGSPSGAWGGKANQIARWTTEIVTPGWEYMIPKQGWSSVYSIADSSNYQFDGSAWGAVAGGGGGGGGGGSITGDLIMAASDMSTALTVGTNKVYAPAPRSGTISGVKANLKTASSSGTVSIDIKKNGASILSTPLTIDAGELTSVSAAVAAAVSDTGIAADDIFSVDVSAAGTGAIGLVVSILVAISGGGGGSAAWGGISGSLSAQTDLVAALAGKADDGDITAMDSRVDALEAIAGKYTAAFGDGSAASFTMTHNLGTRDVHVTVRRSATPYDTIICEVDRTTINTVELYGFSGAPSAGQYTVIVSK